MHLAAVSQRVAAKAPARQQSGAGAFQYTTVAFKSSAAPSSAGKQSKYFHGQPASKGYKSLEVVAGEAEFLLDDQSEEERGLQAEALPGPPSSLSTFLFELVLEPVPIGTLKAALEAALDPACAHAGHAQATIKGAAKLLGIPARLLHGSRFLKAEVLSLSAVQLEQRLTTLQQLLGAPPEAVFDILERQPYILRLEPLEVLSKAASLVQLLGLQQREALAELVASAPDVLTQRQPYEAMLQALEESVQLRGRAAAVKLVLKEPQLLHCVPSRCRGVLECLQGQLDMPFEQARQLVLSAPFILACNPASLHANMRVLMTTFQLDRRSMAGMAVAVPDVLAASPGVLANSARRLKRAAYDSAAWRPALLKLVQQPRNLAVAVSFDSGRYDRLEYLTRTGRDRTIALKPALAMPDDEFSDIYPGYKQWRASRGQQG